MDQTLKLMLKCVKRLSFDRMVGRTGEDNHGWVSGHGALNAALMMDVIIGQARELRHSIYMLFLDLKQFFPAIKRKQRTAAEYFIGLPGEVVRLAKAVFLRMTARFDTAHGLSDSFSILGVAISWGACCPRAMRGVCSPPSLWRSRRCRRA